MSIKRQKKLLASVEDWRGLLAFTFILVGWIAIVLLAVISLELAKLAIAPKLLIDREIAGWYFEAKEKKEK